MLGFCINLFERITLTIHIFEHNGFNQPFCFLPITETLWHGIFTNDVSFINWASSCSLSGPTSHVTPPWILTNYTRIHIQKKNPLPHDLRAFCHLEYDLFKNVIVDFYIRCHSLCHGVNIEFRADAQHISVLLIWVALFSVLTQAKWALICASQLTSLDRAFLP